MNVGNGSRAVREEEWHFQWANFHDQETFLLKDWIAPATLEDFRGRDVLEAGCGGGHHTALIAPYAATVTAVDLNTADIARSRLARFSNIKLVDADLATVDLGRQFDVVVCIGVIHHTADPDVVFANLYRHCRPGGKVIIWTYSAEGNWLVRRLVEPMRRLFLSHLSRGKVVTIARLITAALYPIVYTVYRLPGFSFLPYYRYFKNFRKMSFQRNMLNVFDKLNAPRTIFTTRTKCDEWFSVGRFESETISIRHYAGVSYSLVATKRRH